MSLRGSVEDLPLLEILQVVSFCQKTGYLTVRAPEGDAGVVFCEGRVVAGYIWDTPSAPPAANLEPAAVRARLGVVLERLVRLREGEFAFNLSDQVLRHLGGRDLAGDTLHDGINPEELMLDLARKLDEDRRDCAASLTASFSEPTATPPAADAAEDAEADALEPIEELEYEEPSVTTEPPVEPAASGPLALLVDDEPQVRDDLAQRLRLAGFEVRTAESVSGARRAMERLAAARAPFLLVVDLGLPSESGSTFRAGLDVVRLASTLPAPPPTLLMADAIDEKLIGRARRLGVSLLAFKPSLSKLDPLQYSADLRAFGDKLGRDLLPRLAGRRGSPAPVAPSAEVAARDRTLEAAIAEVDAHPDPDLVAFLLLRAARACFVRAVLFVAKGDRLEGLAGFGPVSGGRSLDLLAREIAVALHPPSPFSEVIASGRLWAGSIPAAGVLATFLEGIGRLAATDAAILPMRAAGETMAVVYADAPDGTALDATAAFARFVERAGRALDASMAGRERDPLPDAG